MAGCAHNRQHSGKMPSHLRALCNLCKWAAWLSNLCTYMAWLHEPPYTCAELPLKAETPTPLPLYSHISSRQSCVHPLLPFPQSLLIKLLKRVLLYILWSVLRHGK